MEEQHGLSFTNPRHNMVLQRILSTFVHFTTVMVDSFLFFLNFVLLSKVLHIVVHVSPPSPQLTFPQVDSFLVPVFSDKLPRFFTNFKFNICPIFRKVPGTWLALSQ